MKFLANLVALTIAAGMQLSAATLTLTPSSAPPTTGTPVTLTIDIGGLPGPGFDPNVGSFDLFIRYDPLLVTPVSATFGLGLGDPSALPFPEALVDFQIFPVTSWVEVAEVSLLSNSALDALQGTSFTLATLSFDRIGDGLAEFQYVYGPVDDSNGTLIFGFKTIPEPGSAALLALGVTALVLRRRRR